MRPLKGLAHPVIISGVVESIYYEQAPSRALQRPRLRRDLCSLALVSHACHEAVLETRLRDSRHAWSVNAEGDGVESTAQTTALLRQPELGQRYHTLVIVLQSGVYTPRLASQALKEAGRLITYCLHLTSLTLFLGKGMEEVQEDGADLLTAALIPALTHLRSFTLCLDATEGPALQAVLGMIGVLGWVKPANLKLVTIRGWRDPATSIYQGDTRYIGPWLKQADPRTETCVTTHLVLKDCHLSAAALAFFLDLFDAILSHLLMSWSKECLQHPLTLCAGDLFDVVAKKRKLTHITIRDLRYKTPFWATDSTKVSSDALLKQRFDSPIYVNGTIRTLAIEMADVHPQFLTRFALPLLEHLHLTASASSGSTPGLLSNRLATDLLRSLDLPAYQQLKSLSLTGLPWALQTAGLLHDACKKRGIHLRIQQ